MKRISSLLIIICLLLTSCQLSNGNLPKENAPKEQNTTRPDSLTAINPSELPSVSVSDFESVTDSSLSGNTVTQSGVGSTQNTTPPATKNPTSPVVTQKPTEPVTQSPPKPKPEPVEMRAIWISCYDYTSAAGKTRSEYKAITDKMFKTIKENGFNTAFVHLRANSDAFYKSDLFPYSSYIAGKEGASLSFDPFEVLLESAKANGISVHGWINPFRVNTKNDVSVLSSSNPAKKILDSGNADGRVCVLSNGIYYNPAHTENHKLILDGVREILGKYRSDILERVVRRFFIILTR